MAEDGTLTMFDRYADFRDEVERVNEGIEDEEMRRARQDAVASGMGFLVDGERVDPLRVQVVRREESGELTDLDAKQLGPFARDSETSRQAALANYPRQGSQRRRILEAFATGKGRMHGFTREELASWTGLPDNSIRPRVGELIAGGWIGQGTKDGVPATRSTRLGNESEVLMLTATAVERLQRAEG